MLALLYFLKNFPHPQIPDLHFIIWTYLYLCTKKIPFFLITKKQTKEINLNTHKKGKWLFLYHSATFISVHAKSFKPWPLQLFKHYCISFTPLFTTFHFFSSNLPSLFFDLIHHRIPSNQQHHDILSIRQL